MATIVPHAGDPLHGTAAGGDVMPAVPEPGETCVSCGAARSGRFCAECGEKRVEPGDYTLRHVLGELAEQFLSLDGRLLRTMKALATRPGLLTAEYIAGRRRLYSKPLSLFVTLNVVFFFAAPHLRLLRWDFGAYVAAPAIGVRDTHAMVAARIGNSPSRDADVGARLAFEQREAAYIDAFNAAAESNKRTLLIFLIPAFALLILALEWRRRRSYVEHLVFSVHSVTWMLLFLLVAVPLLSQPTWRYVIGPTFDAAFPQAGDELVSNVRESVLALFITTGFAVSLTIALRRVYGDRRMGAALKAIALSFSFMLLFQVYRSILFVVTYYTL